MSRDSLDYIELKLKIELHVINFGEDWELKKEDNEEKSMNSCLLVELG